MGPCIQIVYTLASKFSLFRYFEAYIYIHIIILFEYMDP